MIRALYWNLIAIAYLTLIVGGGSVAGLCIVKLMIVSGPWIQRMMG